MLAFFIVAECASACAGGWCSGPGNWSYQIPNPEEPWLIKAEDHPIQRAIAILEAYVTPEEAKTLYADLEGLRIGYYQDNACQSNTQESVDAFREAVLADPSAKSQADALIDVRTRMQKTCDKGMEGFLAEIVGMKAGGGAEFVAYVKGAAQMYLRRDADAVKTFEGLGDAKNEWVKETATYVRARALLRQAQAKWDGYQFGAGGQFGIDQALVDQAGTAFKDYVKAYPKGRYAESATSMERRVLLLKDDRAALQAAVFAAFKQRLAAKDLRTVGRKILGELNYVTKIGAEGFPADQPVLAAAFAGSTEIQKEAAPDILKAVEKNEDAYKAYPGAFALTKAELQLKVGDFAAAEKTSSGALGGEVPPRIALALRQALAEAYVGQKKAQDAAKELTALFAAGPNFKEDEDLVALLLKAAQESKDYKLLFAGDAPTAKPEAARSALRDLFEDADLRKIVAMPDLAAPLRAAAQFPVLEKPLLDQDVEAFLKDYEAFGKPAPFDQVEAAARTLMTTPKDPKALFNYGYFLAVRLVPTLASDHCCACNIVKGLDPYESGSSRKYKQPIEYYVEALENIGPEKGKDLEAKILHHAIMCFKASNAAGYCTGYQSEQKFPKEVRKAWFDRLKTHKGSKWLKQTKYYY